MLIESLVLSLVFTIALRSSLRNISTCFCHIAYILTQVFYLDVLELYASGQRNLQQTVGAVKVFTQLCESLRNGRMRTRYLRRGQ